MDLLGVEVVVAEQVLHAAQAPGALEEETPPAVDQVHVPGAGLRGGLGQLLELGVVRRIGEFVDEFVEHRIGVTGVRKYHRYADAVWERRYDFEARIEHRPGGTGFGAGIVIDGCIYRGAAGRPPDFGHIRYRADGPDVYGKPGCLEGFAAALISTAIFALVG